MSSQVSLKRVDEHLRDKQRHPSFRELYELDEEKLKVAKVVIHERIRRRWTQAALARRLGVTQQQVSKIENGDFDNLGTLQKILTTLGYQIKVMAVPLHAQPLPLLADSRLTRYDAIRIGRQIKRRVLSRHYLPRRRRV